MTILTLPGFETLAGSGWLIKKDENSPNSNTFNLGKSKIQ